MNLPAPLPTMVGEVLAVIRMLAKRDMGMLIVTHEMNFAREVADRVFFFADGSVEMQLEVFYAEADRASEIMLSSGGRAYDLFSQEDNGLGVTILKRMGRKTEYRRENERNKITVML